MVTEDTSSNEYTYSPSTKNSGTPNNSGIQIIQIMVDPVSYKINTQKKTICSASSYTKRRRVKWKLRLTNCDARDTGQQCANTANLRETQTTRGIGTIYTHYTTEQREQDTYSTISMAAPRAVSMAASGAVSMATSTTISTTDLNEKSNFHGNFNGSFHGSFNDNSMETSLTVSRTATVAISMANSMAISMETSKIVCMTVTMTISTTNDNYKDRDTQFSDQYHGNNNDNYKVLSAISQDNPEEGPEGGQSRASPPSK
jgi:hypothetical protein